MKSIKILMLLSIMFAAGSAFIPKPVNSKPTTPGQFWNTSTLTCTAGTSTQTCAANNTGTICKDDISGGTGKDLYDATLATNPCGDPLKKKVN